MKTEIRSGDIVKIMVPGIRAGKIGMALSRVIYKNGYGDHDNRIVWRVLVSGEVQHFINYLLWPITHD